MRRIGTFLLGATLSGALLGGAGAAWVGSVARTTQGSASGGFGVGVMMLYVAVVVLVGGCVVGALFARWVRHPAASTAGYVLAGALLTFAAWAATYR